MRLLPRIGAIAALISMLISPLSAHAQFSGTNGQIYFLYTLDGVTSIAASNQDGSESHIVVQGTANVQPQSFAVSAAGDKLAYVTLDKTAGSSAGSVVYGLMKAGVNGSSPSTLYAGPVTSGFSVNIYNPVFSPDGASVFFLEQGNQSLSSNGIYSIPTAGGSPTQILANVGTTPPSGYMPLVISATNSKMYLGVYHSVADPNNSGSYLPQWEVDSANLDGTSLTKVYPAATTSAAYVPVLDVSPDGTKLILGVTTNQVLENQIIAISDGSTVGTIPVPSGAAPGNASFSSDGLKIIQNNMTYNSSTHLYDFTNDVHNSDLTGTPTSFRNNATLPVETSVPEATAGTYPSPLVDSASSTLTTTTVAESDSQPTLAVTVSDLRKLLVDGSRGDITVQSGGILGGHGTVGVVNVASGGTLAPGNSPGCLASGNVTLVSGANYNVDIAGTTVCTQYDQQVVTGTVDLGGATLNINLTFVPTIGDKFEIISNNGTDAITGTFAGLAEGATVTANGYDFTISYVGGDGNDVELTAVGPSATPALPDAAHAHPNVPIALTLLSLVSIAAIETARRVRTRTEG